MTIYSYSRINTYFNCPAQFRFRYIEKTPSPVPDGIELFLGSQFHEVMEDLYRQVPGRIPGLDELQGLFKKHWDQGLEIARTKQKSKKHKETLRITRDGLTIDDYLKKGLQFIENYHKAFHPFDQDKTLSLEKRVAFSLDPQSRYQMQGFIDRLAETPDGILVIHDYKTGNKSFTEEEARNEDQLALYQIGLSQSHEYAMREKVRLCWHFVATSTDVASERNENEILGLKKKYINKIQEIEKAKDYLTKTSPLCEWCEYLTLCPDGQSAVEVRKKKKENGKTAVSNAEPVAIDPPRPSPPEGTKEPVKTPPQKARKKVLNIPTEQLSLFS